MIRLGEQTRQGQNHKVGLGPTVTEKHSEISDEL